LKSEGSGCIAGNDRRDLLATHIDRNLHQQTFVANVDYGPQQLVSSADRVETDWLTALWSSTSTAHHALDFGAGNAVMTADRFGRMDLSFVNPLLQGRVTDAGHPRCIHRC